MATSGGGSGRRILGWLGPGFGFKRHVAVLALGAVLGALGLSELLRRSHLHALQALNGGVAASSDLEALALLLAGAGLSVYAIGRITRSVVDAAIAPGVGRLFRVYPEAALASRGPVTAAPWVAAADAARSLGYSADTGADWSPEELGAGLGVLLCEATYTREHEGQFRHLSGRQAGRLAAEAGVRKLVVTHRWPSVGADALGAEADEAFGRPVHQAEIGRVFQW